MRIVHRGISLVQRRKRPRVSGTFAGILVPRAGRRCISAVAQCCDLRRENLVLLEKEGLTFDSSVYNHKIVNKSCVSRRKVIKPCHA
jgi:hypothetical protein